MRSRLTMAAGVLFGGLNAFALMQVLNTLWLIPAAKREGRDTYIAEQTAADRKVEIERKGDDAKLRGMSDYDLCVDGLRARRLSVACDELRGLRSE